MDNIQKNFKMKSKLRGMADGGLAQQAAKDLRGRRSRIDDVVDAASAGLPPPQQQAPVEPPPPEQPQGQPTVEGKSAWRTLLGMADGGMPSLGTGLAQQAADKLQTRRSRIDDAVDMASVGQAPVPQQPMPERQPAASKDGLRSLLGLADGGVPMAIATKQNIPGMIAPGNIDLASRPIVKNADGSISTVRSMGANFDGKEYLLPTISDDGRSLSEPEAVELFRKSGRHLGVFDTPENSTAYAQTLHNQQADMYLPKAGNRASELRPENFGAGFNRRGFMHGGDVQGKGGPTDDAIGPVALSDGEYVLPADTVDVVGKEKLDALRLATHDFVDPAKKQGLRGMANGGRFGAPPVAGAANEFAEEASSGLIRKGLGMAGRLATGPVGKLAVYPTVAYGLGKSYLETRDGRAADFEDSIGVDSPMGAAGAGILRNIKNIGDAATGGYASQWGRNLADTISGVPSTQKSAVETTAPQSAPKPTAPQNVGTTSTAGPVQQVAPDSYISRRLAEMGVPVDQQNAAPITEATSRKLLREGTGTPGQYTNLGTYGGNANIYATASKPGGRVNSFVGVGQPQAGENPYLSALRAQLNGAGTESEAGNRRAPADNSYEINKRYDALSDRLTGMYGGKNKGDLARRLLVLEANRSAALGTDNNAQASVYSAGLGADTQAANGKLQSRNAALQQLGALSEKDTVAQAAAQKAQQDAIDKAAEQQLAAQKDARANEETGFKRYNDMIGNMFNGPDDQANKIAREKFTSYLQGSNPKELTSLPNAPDTWEKFAEMSPTKQSMYLQNMRLLHEMGQARNEAATSGLLNEGMTTNRVAMPETVKPAEIGDVFNRHLAPSDYLRSKIPYFSNPNVVVDQTGQATLLDDYASSNGAWDADKLELIRQRTGFDKDGKPVRK